MSSLQILEEVVAHFYEGEMSELHQLTCTLLSQKCAHKPFLIYFNLMARADKIWDVSYDYKNIRGMVWLGNYYLKQAHFDNTYEQNIATSLIHYADSYLHYTGTENAFVSADTKPLIYHSQKALESLQLASETLPSVEDDSIISMLQETYEIYVEYFSGLALYAQSFQNLQDQTISPADFTERLKQLDEYLTGIEEGEDEELHSELLAHKAFLKYHAELAFSEDPTLAPIFVDAKITVGVSAFVNDKVMLKFNQDIRSEEGPEIGSWLDMELEPNAVKVEVLQDIFETATGEEHMSSSVLELDDLKLLYRGKEFILQPQIKFSNLGVVSIEFTFEVESIDELEMQALIDLIAPHAPEALLIDSEIELVSPPATMHPFVLFEGINNTPQSKLDKKLGNYQKVLINGIEDLAQTTNINIKLDHLLEQISPYNEYLVLLVDEKEDFAHLQDLVALQNGSWSYIRDLCDEWTHAILTGIHQRYGLNLFQTSYDSERDWFSIVKYKSIRTDEDGDMLTFPELAPLKRFHWLNSPCRESKASIADWIKTGFQITDADNLAPIRSHITDLLLIRGNQAYLYFPDDPFYLVDFEYIETIRLMISIRTIVNAFTELGMVYHNRATFVRNAFLKADPHKKLYEILEDENQIAEYFKLEADEKLTLLQETMLSRYDDHALLMEAIVRDMGLQESSKMLIKRLDKVVTTQAFLERHAQRLVERTREIKRQQQQALQRKHEKSIRSITTVAAGLYGSSLISVDWIRYTLMAVILTPMATLFIRNWLHKSRVQKEHQQAEEESLLRLVALENELKQKLQWKGYD